MNMEKCDDQVPESSYHFIQTILLTLPEEKANIFFSSFFFAASAFVSHFFVRGGSATSMIKIRSGLNKAALDVLVHSA